VTKYVLGFAFCPNLVQVLVINKTKPDWQVGLLNGVGGSIEEGEAPLRAMAREFHEETGHIVAMTEWKRFATLNYEPGCIVHCFTTRLDKQFSPRKDNPNGERARWRSVDTSYEPNYIPNLKWLIPMALLKFTRPEWEEVGTIILK
jgi:8-oxo-dGTP pyrophosphatase MutT (NUDIX family)